MIYFYLIALIINEPQVRMMIKHLCPRSQNGLLSVFPVVCKLCGLKLLGTINNNYTLYKCNSAEH